MAEDQHEGDLQPVEDSEDVTVTPGYKPPEKKSLKEIVEQDQDDPSLEEYKKKLLGQVEDVKDEGGNNVLVKEMLFIVQGRDNICIDLTGDLTKLKSKPIVIKEGIEFQIGVVFRVQREIVTGLRYKQDSYRKGVRIDKSHFMVGSYGPKTEPHTYKTAKEEAPKGMISRGHYTVKSVFTDDDKNIYLEWEWSFDIKKDWE